jgi:hypothetical protein
MYSSSFIILLPVPSMDHCMATPRVVMLAPGMCLIQAGVIGIAHSYQTSLSKASWSASCQSVNKRLLIDSLVD